MAAPRCTTSSPTSTTCAAAFVISDPIGAALAMAGLRHLLATILLLVTMKSIPSDLYSAAKVDGANAWKRFLHITLPSLRPGFALVIIYETMMAVRHFDLFFILTEGGPAEASYVMAWQVYVETFRKLAFGTGSALAYIMAILTFVLAFSVIRTMGKKL